MASFEISAGDEGSERIVDHFDPSPEEIRDGDPGAAGVGAGIDDDEAPDDAPHIEAPPGQPSADQEPYVPPADSKPQEPDAPPEPDEPPKAESEPEKTEPTIDGKPQDDEDGESEGTGENDDQPGVDDKPRGAQETENSGGERSVTWSFTTAAPPPPGITFSGQRATILRPVEPDETADGGEDETDGDPPGGGEDGTGKGEGKAEPEQDKEEPSDPGKAKAENGDPGSLDDDPRQGKEVSSPGPAEAAPPETAGRPPAGAESPPPPPTDDGEIEAGPPANGDDPATAAALRALQQAIEREEAEMAADDRDLQPLPAATVVREAGASQLVEDPALVGQVVDAMESSRNHAAERLGVPTVEAPPWMRDTVPAIVDAARLGAADLGFDVTQRVVDPRNVLIYGPDEWQQIVAAAGPASSEAAADQPPEPVIVLPDGTILVNAGGEESAVLTGVQRCVAASMAARVYVDGAAPESNGQHAVRLARVGYAEHNAAQPGSGDYSALDRVATALAAEAIMARLGGPPAASSPGDTEEMQTGRYLVEAIVAERTAQSGRESAEVVAEVYELLEIGRLTGQPAIVDELVRATYGSEAAVAAISGWGAADGFGPREVRGQLELLHEQKLERERSAEQNAAEQRTEAEAALEGLAAAIKTGDVRSEGHEEGGALTAGLNRLRAAVQGTVSSGGNNTSNGGSATESSTERPGPDVVYEPILEGAEVAVPAPQANGEHGESDGANAESEITVFQPARERMSPGMYARTVRQTARELGMSNQQMRQYEGTAGLEEAVSREINRRIGAAAVGIGANRLVQTLRTGDDEIQVIRPGIVVDGGEIQRMVERHFQNERRGPDIIAHAILNTVIRTERGLWRRQAGAGTASKLYAEEGRGPAPRVFAPPPVRRELTPGQRAAHERVRNMRHHPQQFNMGQGDTRRGQRYANHPHRNPRPAAPRAHYTEADFRGYSTPGQRFHNIVNRLRSRAPTGNRGHRPVAWWRR